MSGKRPKPYFPNNWKKFKDAPPEAFFDHLFIEVMDWKVAGWEIPSNVACMIRATNLKNGRVKEHIYKRQHAAEAKVLEYMNKQTHEFVVCTHEAIHYIHPDRLDDANDF